VRVQIGQHAADCVGNQFLVFDRFNIALLDGIEYLGKGAQLFDRQPDAHFFFGHRRKLQADQNSTQ